MFTVTQRLDGEPGGPESRAEVSQVKFDFSTPSRTAAPCNRPAGPRRGGLCPFGQGRRGREQIEERFWKM